MTRARFWTGETVYSETCELSLDEWAEVRVDAEVPRSADGERLPRRGNRYCATSVRIEVSNTGLSFVSPEEARRLAATLIVAAAKAEEIDQADADPCGHWHPCDCRSKEVAQPPEFAS